MKKLLFVAVLLLGTGVVHNAAAITLTNHSGQIQNFWVQYEQNRPGCKSNKVTLRARGQGRSSIRIGNCPLRSINQGDELSQEALRADLTNGQWEEINFYPSGFYPDTTREITLVNDSGQTQTFWVQYAKKSRCKSGRVQLTARGSGRSVRIVSGGDCPLISINQGSSFNENAPMVKIRQEMRNRRGENTGDWKTTPEWSGGKTHIHFYPKGFFSTPLRLRNAGGGRQDFYIKYKQQKFCKSDILRNIHGGGTVRIFSGGDCPIERISNARHNPEATMKDWGDGVHNVTPAGVNDIASPHWLFDAEQINFYGDSRDPYRGPVGIGG